MKRTLYSILFLLLFGCQSITAEEKPNIIFILADDQGYGDLSCFGSEVIETPNIDRLANEGMKFESFYVHNRCSPTRAAFLTGCHAQRVDIGKVIYHKDSSGLSSSEITIAELLKEAGYATGIVGKWHVGEWPKFNPLNHGFDKFVGYMANEEGKRAIYEDREIIGMPDNSTDRFSTMTFQPASIRFIREHKDEPFFLYYASNIPHTNWIPHQAFAGDSKQGVYGDCVQQLDWVVGEMLKELDALGISENTLVIFASDNGPQLNVDGYGSAYPLRDGKWTNFEGGIRTPCVMRWPARIQAGTSNNEIIGIIDMLPTFCELAGVEVPSDRIIDGRSILPYMKGETVEQPIHETFIVAGSAIRHGDWKLFITGEMPGGNIREGVGMQGRLPADAGSLFNLREDIGENLDVSAAHPEIVAALEEIFGKYMEEFKENIRPREYIDSK